MRQTRFARDCAKWTVLSMAIFLGINVGALAAPPNSIKVTLDSAPGASSPAYVEALKTVIWPVTILILGFVFRSTLGGFVNSLSGRMTRFAIAGVEIELASAAQPDANGSLEQIRELSPG